MDEFKVYDTPNDALSEALGFSVDRARELFDMVKSVLINSNQETAVSDIMYVLYERCTSIQEVVYVMFKLGTLACSPSLEDVLNHWLEEHKED